MALRAQIRRGAQDYLQEKLSQFPDSVCRRGAVPQMEEIVQSPSRSDIPPLNPYAQVGRSYFTRGSATYPPAP